LACDEKRETSLRRREMRKSTNTCLGVWGSTREAPVALPRRACGPALEPQAKHLGIRVMIYLPESFRGPCRAFPFGIFRRGGET